MVQWNVFLLILYTKQEKKVADVSSGVCKRRDISASHMARHSYEHWDCMS